MERSTAGNQSPDFHAALIKVFDTTESMIDEYEIRSISMDPDDHPWDQSTLFNFYTEAIGQKSTILHECFGEWQDREQRARQTSPEDLDQINKESKEFNSPEFSFSPKRQRSRQMSPDIQPPRYLDLFIVPERFL